MNRLIIIVLMLLSFLKASGQYDQTGTNEITFALIEASRLKVLGNFEEAARLYKLALSYDPHCAAAWYELGVLYTNSGNYAEAKGFVENAYEIDNNNYWYLIAYAELLALNENYKKSNIILRRGIKAFNGEEITLRLRVVENLQRDGQYRRAVKELENIEKRFGYSELISLQKIENFENLGRERRVRETYDKILEYNPHSIHTMLLYAEFLHKLEDFKKSIGLYEDVLGIDPSNIFAISNLADLYGKTGDIAKSYHYLNVALQSQDIPNQKKIQTLVFLLADEERVKRDKSEISGIILNLVEQDSNNYELLIVAYDFFFKTGDYQESFNLIRRLVELRDDNYILWAQSLYNANLLSDYEEMLRLGKQSLRIFPNKDDLRVFIAIAYFQKSRYEEALEILRETNNRFTEPTLEFQNKVLIAESLFKTGASNEAFEMFEKLLVLDPDNIFIKNNYSYYLSLEELNLERAKALSKETLVEDPDNPTFLDTYGWILYKSGENQEAEYYIRRAYELDTTRSDEIIDHMIEILTVNEKFEEAEKIKKERR